MAALLKPLLKQMVVGVPSFFSPLSLFEPGDKGFLYEPSTISNLDTGSGPVTADADPIGSVVDSSGNGNPATQTTSGDKPAYYSPRWMDFDGSTDHLRVVDNEAGGHDFTDFDQTISGAFRVQVPDNFTDAPDIPDFFSAATIAELRQIFGFSGLPYTFNFGFRDGYLMIGSAASANNNTGGAHGESSGVSFSVGEEVTVGFTINGNDWALFVDGEENNSGTFTALTGVSRAVGSNPASLKIAARSRDNNATGNLYNGRIGDGLLIDKVLTAADFANLHTIWSAS